jgi:hypothetical protein
MSNNYNKWYLSVFCGLFVMITLVVPMYVNIPDQMFTICHYNNTTEITCTIDSPTIECTRFNTKLNETTWYYLLATYYINDIESENKYWYWYSEFCEDTDCVSEWYNYWNITNNEFDCWHDPDNYDIYWSDPNSTHIHFTYMIYVNVLILIGLIYMIYRVCCHKLHTRTNSETMSNPPIIFYTPITDK